MAGPAMPAAKKEWYGSPLSEARELPAVHHEKAPLEAGEIERRSQTGWTASDHQAVKQFPVVQAYVQAARGGI